MLPHISARPSLAGLRLQARASRLGVLTSLAVSASLVARFLQYLADRSLWLDEVMISLNVLQRSFARLLQPLDFHQAAPPGFLWLQKLATLCLGESEWALRLIPLLAGSLALVWFAGVARHYLPPPAVPIATALFALSDPLIYYASEAKQYANDILAAVAILWLAADMLREERPTLLRCLAWGAFGAVLVWFAHPAVFLLAGAGGGILLTSGLRRDWSRFWTSAGIALSWGLSFALLYALVLHGQSANPVLQDYWRDSFVVLRFSWLFDRFFALFAHWVGGAVAGLAAWSGIVGCGVWASERRVALLIVLLPFAVVVGASALQLYPFASRLVLFLAPGAFLLIASGALQTLTLARLSQLRFLGAAFLSLLLLEPVYVSAYHLLRPRTQNEIKPVLQYLQRNAQPEDVLYVDWPTDVVLQYYAPRYPLTVRDVRLGVETNELAPQLQAMDQLPNEPRVWLLYSHWGAGETDQSRNLLLAYLDRRGRKLDAYTAPGAAVYLYDLSLAEQP
jgi:4-amino-4-deoxy-L-arabinose transferase-like glycosyltransferase